MQGVWKNEGKKIDKKDRSSDFMFLFFACSENTALDKDVILSVEDLFSAGKRHRKNTDIFRNSLSSHFKTPLINLWVIFAPFSLSIFLYF